MSGDVGIYEQVVVISEGSADWAATASAVQELPNSVVHQYGSRVMLVGVAPDQAQSLEDATPAAVHPVDASKVSAGLKAQLDEVGALGLEAFNLRQSAEYAEAKANRPLQGEAWDSVAASMPDPPEGHEILAVGSDDTRAGGPTSARMTGRVAVGIMIVEGPSADLQFSTAERTKVVAEVQNGLSWLGSQSSPGGITWVYDIRTVRVTVPPGPNSASGAEKEALWRDPAMVQLGYATGMGGVTAYVEKLRTSLNTNWTYCGFFTKYPLGHFAYASIGGPRLVMNYSNDGWQPDNIDRVFAHETGHIFGAPDEYAASACTCGGEWGWFKKPNSNCENCASAGVACIMKANSWEMCSVTPYHLGFPQGRKYSGVFRAGTGGHGLWVNADWNNFVTKWQEWSSQGLRLEDLEINVSGSDVRYSGAFLAGTDGHGLWVNADWNSFVAKWQEWNNQGLRLIDIDVVEIGGQVRYSGVFRAGTGGHGLWVNADWNSFVAKWQEWSNQGLRLTALKIASIGGQLRYTGVFRAGTGGHGLWVNADWNSFVAKWQEWNKQGLRLVDIELSTVGGQMRYSGVFLAGTYAYGLWVNDDWTSFRAQWDKWSSQGLRLINFKNVPSGIEGAFAPTADGAADGLSGLAIPSALGMEESVDEEDSAGFGAVDIGAGLVIQEVLTGAGYGSIVSVDRPIHPSEDDGRGFGAATLDDGFATASASGSGRGGLAINGKVPSAAQG